MSPSLPFFDLVLPFFLNWHEVVLNIILPLHEVVFDIIPLHVSSIATLGLLHFRLLRALIFNVGFNPQKGLPRPSTHSLRSNRRASVARTLYTRAIDPLLCSDSLRQIWKIA
jgi:hypothetical protein